MRYAIERGSRAQTSKGHKIAVLMCLALMFIWSTFALAGAASWSLSADHRNGLPLLTVAGNAALSADFVFWGKNWAWADLPPEFKVIAPFEYAIAGKNKPLNFDLTAHAKKLSARQLAWEFNLNASSATPGVIGGGISFKLNLPAFAAELGEPELLPDNRGWSWGRQGKNRLEMRFDPPMASVYFERGQKSEIRTFFYKGEIPEGSHRYVATVEVFGDIAIGPSTVERFGLQSFSAWPADIMDWRTSPVDLSFLNAPEKPAGKRGFVRTVGDSLVFDDGTRARFWGTNITAFALFDTIRRDDVAQAAKRLSQLGFNLVRLHHHNSPWVNPNVFGEQAADTKTVSDTILERLDWWIKCLKDEGIYVFLDLHVQRHLTPNDGIDGFDEISKGKSAADLKGFNYINTSIQTAMQRFNEAYVTHVNRFTGLRYKDDPALIAMLLTNENDVTHHFGNALLPDKKVPKHNALYMALAEKFAVQHGLAKDRTWRSWEHGPSKIFLNDLENRFNGKMIAQLRSLGVKVPIVTTSTWGMNPLSSLPALTAGGLIAVHSYGAIGEIERSPFYGANMMHWMATAQVAGKPLIVPEWNVSPFPAPDRHTIPMYIAASARYQGWDAVMQYAYAQQAMTNAGSASNWHAFNDPSLIATLPAAALLYRRGDVRSQPQHMSLRRRANSCSTSQFLLLTPWPYAPHLSLESW